MPETISVIIPVYRVEQYLEACISSVVNQSYPYLEIILVDDGSPDQCGTMCDAWKEKDPRVEVIHKENGGLSDARNAGLNIARGRYIAFVDSDDVIETTMMSKLLYAMQQQHADIVECNYSCFTDTVPCDYNEEISQIIGYTKDAALKQLLKEQSFKYTVWNKLYCKEIFDSVRFEVGKLHEDVFFTYQAFGLCNKITKIEDSLYYYRQRQGSIMGAGFSPRSIDSLVARERQYFYMKKNFPDLAGIAQTQVLNNCLYMGQRVLTCENLRDKNETFERIYTVYSKIYEDRKLQEFGKQEIWYRIAKGNFKLCCMLRNTLRIGL